MLNKTQARRHLVRCVGVVLLSFALLGSVASAQLVPPGATQWWHNGDGDWETDSNWNPGISPSDFQNPADVLFSSVPNQGDLSAITVSMEPWDWPRTRSLWFDADSGINYTINGSTLDIGYGVPSDGNLVTVNSSGTKVVETNINGTVYFSANTGWDGFIINHSQGGLRFGGLIQGSRYLRVSGSGATHFAGNLDIGGGIETVPGSGTHLILSGEALYYLNLRVGAETLVFVKRNKALGSVNSYLTIDYGGTLGIRSHVGESLNYSEQATLNVSGPGAVRALGRPAVGAIYHDGGGSPTDLNQFAGTIIMTGDTTFGARGDAGGLLLSGEVYSSTYPSNDSFSKVGLGLITLSNPNNDWTGSTIIWDGVLRTAIDTTFGAPPGSAIPTFSTIYLKGGILELGDTNFNGVLGSKIQWGDDFGNDASGGFSAFGGNRSVEIQNWAGGLAWLTWGAGGFVGNNRALLLSSRYANAQIDFKNPINLGNGSREIRVERGHTDAHARLSGAITASGFGRLVKTGPGMLWLTEPIDYQVQVNEGVLRGTLGGGFGNSNLRLSGGVFGLDSDFTGSLGTGPGQVIWGSDFGLPASGGFAAYGGDRIVRLNNTPFWADIAGHPGFVQPDQELRFGHYTADGTVIWDKELSIERIRVERGRNPNVADVRFTQAILPEWFSGSEIRFVGDGRADITSHIARTTHVSGVELRLHDGGMISGNNVFLNILNGGVVTLDNLTGSNHPDRLNDSSKVSVFLSGGTLRLWGQPNGTSQELADPLLLQSIFQSSPGTLAASNTIELKHNSTGISDFTELRFAFLYKEDFFTLNYRTYDRFNAILEDFSKARLSFTFWSPSDAINHVATGTKITPWGVVNGLDFMTPVAANGVTELRPVTNYYTNTNSNNWNPSINLFLDEYSTSTLVGNRAINSLKIGDGASLTSNANYTLTINSGGLLAYSGEANTGGRLTIRTANNRPLYAHIYGSSLGLTGSSRFDVPNLVKTGPGALNLGSAATHNVPNLYIHEGTVNLSQGTLHVNNIYIGDGAGRDILVLPANSTDALRRATGRTFPNVFLRGTPHGLDPSNVYGGEQSDQAILRLSGNTKQHLAVLNVMERGTIDFAGGEVGLANILWIDQLNFLNAAGNSYDPSARLFIRNWYQYEDYLLISRGWINTYQPTQLAEFLNQIVFDGYQDFRLVALDYDSQYYAITPFNHVSGVPEPQTYGAILAAVGIGMVVWAKRRPVRQRARRSVKQAEA